LASDSGIWALIPAAGSGSRMGASVPKQYLSIAGLPVLTHTLNRLGNFPGLRGIVVGLSPDDGHWAQVEVQVSNLPVPLYRCEGGVERAETVLKALHHLTRQAERGDRVLVHDAVRPCVRHGDISALIASVADRDEGGLLATPVVDTLKRSDEHNAVTETVDRNRLWRALTPQLFPIELLRDALEQAMDRNLPVTDEASAMEAMGLRPLCVPGQADNIKITWPEDLALAEYYLARQEQEGGS
jgi:2-C-methyl-D-erythritol 4-phosphate cytidylyltransferase